MHRSILLASYGRIALPLLVLLLVITTTTAQSLAPAGHWKGNLMVQGTEMPIIFHIQQDKEGEWKATFDSPKQMVYGVDFDKVEATGKQLRLEIKAARLVYEGAIGADGQTITGTWNQAGGTFPLNLTATEDTRPKRPQTPKAPFPYDVETVEFNNPTANITLAGTLTLPENKQNCPAVVLISGSGPQDRDGTVLQHQPFWVLADYLSRQGMVVLRVDDRGVGKSGGNFGAATSADFATDVEAAVRYLQKHPRVNSRKVGLIGHSEGGMIAPLVASRKEDVAFVVLLAGPGATGQEVMQQQNYDLFLQQTNSPQLAQYRRDLFETIYTTVVKEENQDKSTTELLALLQKDLDKIPAKDRATIGLEEKGVRAMIAQFRSPWLRYFLAFDPQDYLPKVQCPVLAINGDKDLQVHVDNLKSIEKGLKKGNNNNYQILALPNLNHLLQTSETGAMDEYATLEETISPRVLEAIDAWLKKVEVY